MKIEHEEEDVFGNTARIEIDFLPDATDPNRARWMLKRVYEAVLDRLPGDQQ